MYHGEIIRKTLVFFSGICVLLIGAYSVSASVWVGPSGAPSPATNTINPIDTGGDEVKMGSLIVGNFSADSIRVGPTSNSSAVTSNKYCIGASCITTFGSDNLGTHIATMALNMSNFNITNIGKATGVSTVAGDSSNTLVTKSYVDALAVCSGTVKYYQCPNIADSVCVTSSPCVGQKQDLSYCYTQRFSGSMGCSGCGCYSQDLNSCTPVY